MMLTLSPAYGRDYKGKKALLADFDAQKDFVVQNFLHPDCGRYVNKQQLIGQTVSFRYNRLRNVTGPITVK